MKIWIINQYASLPSTGIGGRHRHLARELAARGHDVTLVAARWNHLTRDEAAAMAAPEVEMFEGFRYVSINVPRYAHAHDKRRFINWVVFAMRMFRLKRLLKQTPDVILYSSVSLFGYLSAERMARRMGARLVFEVRDIWPLTLIQVGGMSPRHPVIRLMQWIEDRAYRTADHVISNLPGAIDHMQTRGLPKDRFTWVPNGVSLTEMSVQSAPQKAVLEDIPIDRFVIGYAGSLGTANAMLCILGIAEKMKHIPDIVFVLVGAGRQKADMQAQANERNLNNLLFLDPVPKDQVQNVLARFDVCFISWAHSPLYNFGIAANKLFDYFYAGRPILQMFSGQYDPVSEHGAGITVEAEDEDAAVNAALQLWKMSPEGRNRMGENGRRAVLEHHEYGHLAAKLEAVLQPHQPPAPDRDSA